MIASFVDTDNAVQVAVAILVASFSLYFLANKYSQSNDNGDDCKKKNSGVPLPPLSDQSFFECIQEIQGPTCHEWVLQTARRLGVDSFRVPFINLYMVGDAKLTRAILNDPTTTKLKFFCYQARNMNPGSSISMFTVPDLSFRWKHARKAMTRPFSDTDYMINTLKSVLDDWIANKFHPQFVQKQAKIEIDPEFRDLTTRVICEVAAEYTPTAQDIATINDEGELMMNEFMKDAFANPFRIPFWFLFKKGRRARKAQEIFGRFPKALLETHRQRKAQGKPYRKGSLIDVIDCNEDYANDAERVADVVVLIGAGVETTSAVFAFALYELAKDPEYQKKVRTTLQSLKSWKEGMSHPIIKNVIRETMRLHPPISLASPRVTGKEYNNGKIRIPKGSVVMNPPYISQRNGKVFPNPDKFDPDRWTNAPNLEDMMESWYPFSIGRRNCLGMGMANLEMEMGLALLLRDYEFSMEQDNGTVYYFTLHPKDLWLNVKKVAKEQE